jgi:hypothetical protein
MVASRLEYVRLGQREAQSRSHEELVTMGGMTGTSMLDAGSGSGAVQVSRKDEEESYEEEDCGWLEHHHLKGGHHLHIEPDTAPEVAALVGRFMKNVAAAEVENRLAARRKQAQKLCQKGN